MQRVIKLNLINETSSVFRRSLSIGRTASYQSFNVQDQEDFQKRVLNASTPVLVDFHARWCGPCKTLGPRLEALAVEKLDKFHLAKVDIDNVPELAEEYNVTAVPSVIAIKGGKVEGSFVGVLDDDKLRAFVNKLIGE
ncbi:thioredoxin, mitochondrial-like [Daphnia carinata]|uniref:thioredoxin, mitochondrial-like n=1 Tax=Daphnia carinata TaxID=120202 RepID=UPI00257B317C|nr:thioredoxin, mitochondrial-like [Daphnia carinata]